MPLSTEWLPPEMSNHNECCGQNLRISCTNKVLAWQIADQASLQAAESSVHWPAFTSPAASAAAAASSTKAAGAATLVATSCLSCASALGMPWSAFSCAMQGNQFQAICHGNDIALLLSVMSCRDACRFSKPYVMRWSLS